MYVSLSHTFSITLRPVNPVITLAFISNSLDFKVNNKVTTESKNTRTVVHTGFKQHACRCILFINVT